MSRWYGLVCLMLLLRSAVPAPVQAQARAQAQLEQAGRAAVGAAVGAAGGAAITLAVVVARARFDREYLDSVDDLLHWQSTPMIAAPLVGVAFGLAGRDALEASIVGSVAGMTAGAALGAGLGWLLSDEQEWPWAGGVIGAGVGMTAGGLVEGLRAWREDPDADVPFPRFLRFGLSVPVP